MNQLERRLALLEIRQPPQAAFATVASDWLGNWDEIAPRLETTYQVLHENFERDEELGTEDAHLLRVLLELAYGGDVTEAVKLMLEEFAVA